MVTVTSRRRALKAARTRALNAKHAGTAKHSSTAKHTPTATKKTATAHAQKATRTAAQVKAAHLRAWSPDSEFAICSARAVAESLRLALGVVLADEDVLGLHWSADGDPDAGASILAVLEAGLALLPPFTAACLPLDGRAATHVPAAVVAAPAEGVVLGTTFARALPHAHSLILGLDLPEGPHSVVEHDGAWWSWGRPYSPGDFPGAVIEEAWQVVWPC